MIIINKADIKKEQDTDDRYAYTKLYRLSKQGKIKKIIKGKYTTANDIYKIATNIHTPSYLSFWSCLQHKGYTEQILNTIQVATTKRYKKIIYDNYTIEFIKVKDFFGYERIDGLFIAEDEKLLIDILLKERYIGNFDEIKKAFINSTINKEKMIEYLKRINNNMLIKRIGYMLYTYKKIDISEHFILDKNYATLTLNGTLIDRKWRIKYDN